MRAPGPQFSARNGPAHQGRRGTTFGTIDRAKNDRVSGIVRLATPGGRLVSVAIGGHIRSSDEASSTASACLFVGLPAERDQQREVEPT